MTLGKRQLSHKNRKNALAILRARAMRSRDFLHSSLVEGRIVRQTPIVQMGQAGINMGEGLRFAR